MQAWPRKTASKSFPAHGQGTLDQHRPIAPGDEATDTASSCLSGDEPNTPPSLCLPDSLWDPTLAERARESICFSKPWLDLVKRVYGYKVFYLTTTGTDGPVTGVLPLCSVRTPLGGRHLAALPFSDLCPLLITDPAIARGLIDQAIYLAHQQGAAYLELRAGAEEILTAREDLAAQDLYLRYWLPLDGDPATLWRGLAPSMRKKVNKARRLGVRMRMASSREDMLHFYRLHLQTRSRKHGMPAQPKSFFLGLWDAFAAAGAIQIFLAEYEGLVIAADIVLTAGASANAVYEASDERYLHLAPNNLLVWSVIEWACIQGHRALDLGRTARDNHGLMEFKRHLGAVAEPLTYYYHPHPAGLAATSESSRKYKLLTSCWRQLPLPIAASVGGRLYKYLG